MSIETKHEYETAGFIISSRYRIQAVRSLHERPSTPSGIAEQFDVSIAHVSRALGELRERELVELLVPEDRKKGRIYGLTEEGADLIDDLETLGVDI